MKYKIGVHCLFALQRLKIVFTFLISVIFTTYGYANETNWIIGRTSILTGPAAGLSNGPDLGIQALVKEVNATGGVHGKQLKLITMDDAFDSMRAENNVRQLIDKNAIAILMPIGTNSSLGAIKAGNALQIPVIAPYSGAESVASFSLYGFSLRISFEEEYERIINQIMTLGIERIAFARNDNPGALAAMQATSRSLEKRGKTLVESVAIAQDATNIERHVKTLIAANPQAIVLSTTNHVAAKLISAYRSAGGHAQFYSFSFLNGAQLHKDIGKNAMGTVILQVVPNPWRNTIPLVAEYQNAMKKAGFNEWSYSSLEGYLAAKVLVLGLKKAGKTATRQSLKRILETFNFTDLGGVDLTYTDAYHKGLSYSELTMVRDNGTYVR